MTAAQNILVPNHLNLTNAVQFACEMAELPESKVFIPDFSNVTWIEPFAMLILSHAFCDLKDRNPDATIIPRTPTTDACSYADWMGFFKAANLRKESPEAPGSETYLPITFVNIKDMITDVTAPTNDIIKLAKKLARQLIRQDDGDLVEAVEYAFQEILRNVVEHSESKELAYCAQYWSRGPKANMVEIAMMDTGIGLQTSLKRNPHLTITSDRDAIMYALSPGVSGKAFKGAKTNWYDPSQNSGLGLFMNYRLCNEGGSFFIGSGTVGLHRKKDQDNRYHDMKFTGTILRLRLNALQLKNTRSLLEQFSDDAHKLAKNFGGTIPSPATMSKMLSEDFFALQKLVSVGDRVVHPKYNVGTIAELITLSTKEPGAVVHFDNGRRQKVALDTLVPVFEQ